MAPRQNSFDAATPPYPVVTAVVPRVSTSKSTDPNGTSPAAIRSRRASSRCLAATLSMRCWRSRARARCASCRRAFSVALALTSHTGSPTMVARFWS
jgi:hypothetical protein